MCNDVIIAKFDSIQRARVEYAADPDGFAANFTRQDAATLNVLSACEQAIDLANHVIKSQQLGIPTSSTESFDLLRQAQIIDATMTRQLQKLVRFRNLIVHRYEEMDLTVLQNVITTSLDDLLAFGEIILAYSMTEPRDRDQG